MWFRGNGELEWTALTAKLLRLFLLVILLFGFPVWSRAAVGGSISGIVKDESDAVVPKAKVTAMNTDTGLRQVVMTDGTGAYSFPILPVGHYDGGQINVLRIFLTRPFRRVRGPLWPKASSNIFRRRISRTAISRRRRTTRFSGITKSVSASMPTRGGAQSSATIRWITTRRTTLIQPLGEEPMCPGSTVSTWGARNWLF